jgi:hypothetical protein
MAASQATVSASVSDSQATVSDGDLNARNLNTRNLWVLAAAAAAAESCAESSWVPGPASLAMDASTVAANRVLPLQGPQGGRSCRSLRLLAFAPEQPQHRPSTGPCSDVQRFGHLLCFVHRFPNRTVFFDN